VPNEKVNNIQPIRSKKKDTFLIISSVLAFVFLFVSSSSEYMSCCLELLASALALKLLDIRGVGGLALLGEEKRSNGARSDFAGFIEIRNKEEFKNYLPSGHFQYSACRKRSWRPRFPFPKKTTTISSAWCFALF
jgi:hypothetical protein